MSEYESNLRHIQSLKQHIKLTAQRLHTLTDSENDDIIVEELKNESRLLDMLGQTIEPIIERNKTIRKLDDSSQS